MFIVKNNFVHVYPVDPGCLVGEIKFNPKSWRSVLENRIWDDLEQVDAVARNDAKLAGVQVHYPFRCIRCLK